MIELLVVVIVLGILAGIAIPVFLGQREAAQDAQTALLSYQVESGSYPLGDETSVTEMEEIEPTIKWTKSRNEQVSLNSDAMVGAVPFERYPDESANSSVFGTRSASGECFYMIIDANGTRYGRDTQCDDPYETSDAGRITESGW